MDEHIELGQYLFGQPWQENKPSYQLSSLIEGMALILDYYISKNPFRNTGAKLKTPTIIIEAYSWSDKEQPFNLAWRDFRASWYKYVTRGLSVNRELSQKESIEMLEELIDWLREEI